MDPATDLEARSTGAGYGSGSGSGDGKAIGEAANGSGLKLSTGVGAPNGQTSSDDDADAAHDDSDAWASAVTSPASITSPPYWTNAHSHQRSISNISNISAESVLPAGAITMQDHEVSDPDHRNKACWAKSVEIVDHVVINGSATNIGAFVVWNIRVETLRGSFMNIRKRYSEFDDLREKLMITFPHFEAAVPPLPPKSVISKFRPRFLDKRRQGLQYFLNCIMLNPEFSGSPVLKDFLFS
ncbi:hypothetical protein ACHAQA_000460 [Verticillium albo-atrum]